VKLPGGIDAQVKVWVTGIEEPKKSEAEEVAPKLADDEAEDDEDDDD
jgi:hypothetical protein